MTRRTRFNRIPRSWGMSFGPNTTPMADVILVILIFFMAGVALVGPSWFMPAAIDSPGDEPAPAEAEYLALPPATFTIRLTRSGDGVLISGIGPEPCSINQAGARILALTGGAPTDDVIVSVAPDGDVPMQAVVDIHDACRAAGIRRIGLVTLKGGE